MGYCSYSQHFCFCIKPPVILAFMLQTYPTDCDKAINARTELIRPRDLGTLTRSKHLLLHFLLL
jgi:hypothetical protein